MIHTYISYYQLISFSCLPNVLLGVGPCVSLFSNAGHENKQTKQIPGTNRCQEHSWHSKESYSTSLEPGSVISLPIQLIEWTGVLRRTASLKRQCFEYRKQHHITCTIHIDNTLQDNISRYVLLSFCHNKAEGGAIWNKAGIFGPCFVITFFKPLERRCISPDWTLSGFWKPKWWIKEE